MLAETANNVIDALSEKEYTRLLQMRGLEPKPKKAKRKKLISPTQATEYLYRTLP